MNDGMEQLLLLWTTPFMLVLVLAELAYSAWKNTPTYEVKDTFYNLLFPFLNFLLDLVMRGVSVAILLVFYNLSPIRWEQNAFYWVILFLSEDLAYYTLHCADHYVRFFWATHVTHHNSQKFNLTVAIRSSIFQPVYRFLFFIPLALAGFNPWHILFMYALTQVYGFWIHTEHIKKMPAWFEFIMVTPSHHRVHHASNLQYLDKNMGMVLIIWDRLFGTFQPEEEKPHYGVTYPIVNHTPQALIFGEWGKLWKDVASSPTWKIKLQYLLNPPGWSPDGSTLTSTQLRANIQNSNIVKQPIEFQDRLVKV
jgi:sterol desaturase/sphingolipid hydroxylase (fatty acid hydroxylase superfamily)